MSCGVALWRELWQLEELNGFICTGERLLQSRKAPTLAQLIGRKKDNLATELINDECVYRTAPATPGLLNITNPL